MSTAQNNSNTQILSLSGCTLSMRMHLEGVTCSSSTLREAFAFVCCSCFGGYGGDLFFFFFFFFGCWLVMMS